ncbi:MAG: NAD(P)-dependent oxidoreductase [Candidatus Latescibacterota bacterium]|jgi:3-hydroxyisobutyrate dehydrogenase
MPVSPETTRIGFVGLGIMGAPMALNLLKAGYAVEVYNRTDRPRVDQVVAAGGRRVASPQLAAANAEVVITMVTDTPDVEAVILGPEGVIHGARPGTTVIDMSTVSPRVTRQIGARLAEGGVAMLDAPVSGGEAGARNGTLSIMVGGEPEVFENCLPVLQALGRSVTLMGKAGAGQTTKLCNQIAVAVNNLAMAEALTLAATSELDPRLVLAAISGGAGGSWYLSNLGPRILDGDFAPGFTVDLQQKDLRLVLGAAADVQLPLPGVSLVNQLFNLVQRLGCGGDGVQALIKAYERQTGIEVRGNG